MPTEATQHVLTATLRANPRYELVAFDRLSPSEQALLDPLTADADFHGVLRPREPGTLAIKGVSHDTARLVRALERPGRVPPFVHADSSTSGDHARRITRLVLDGVLEVERDASFVSGPAAAVLTGHAALDAAPATAIARLSVAALRYAQSLPIDDSLALSARMYFHNRTPVSPRWRRRYADPATIASFLGLHALDQDAARGSEWRRSGGPSLEHEGWFKWRRPGNRGTARPRRTATFKLYVSARHDSLRDVVHLTLPILRRSDATAFKIGSTEQQLCRPDKFVTYFETRAALDEVASELSGALHGAAAQGVPFTATITDDGLLSWGVDPPPAPQVMWREHESWRLWVTNRLAIALVAARRAGAAEVEPWQFAVRRLELDGVDTSSWTPDAGFWHDTAPGASE